MVPSCLYHRRQAPEYPAPVRNMDFPLFTVHRLFRRYDRRAEGLADDLVSEAYAQYRYQAFDPVDQFPADPGIFRMPRTGGNDQVGRVHADDFVDGYPV